jgi:hypothetical protein
LQTEPDHGTTWENQGKSFALAVGGTESAFLVQKVPFVGGWKHPATIPSIFFTLKPTIIFNNYASINIFSDSPLAISLAM